MIRRTTRGGQPAWQVQSEAGKPLGTYLSLVAAKKRLAQIEHIKNMKSAKSSGK
jgi:hypothetical protein